MFFENIGHTNVNSGLENLRKSFDNIYWKPNHLNKLIHGCITEIDLTVDKNEEKIVNKECIECKISAFVLPEKSIKNEIESDCNVENKRQKLEENNTASNMFASCSSCINGENKVFKNVLKELVQKVFTGSNYGSNFRCFLRKLIPKNTKKFKPLYECLAQETTDTSIRLVVIPICLVNENIDETLLIHKSYGFVYKSDNNELQAYIHKNFHLDAPTSSLVASKSWLLESVLPKLKKWGEASNTHHSYQFDPLVDMERYSTLYFKLKEKYGPYFVSIWPENTDPLKFVYEDIAIATYLLLIWEDDRKRKNLSDKQSFVDLGCGNGLLVYILTKEGHPGKGIDIVRRKIWDLYENVVLEECTILPHTFKVDVDWIVGNHTDELTPWIPVIAVRSSYSVNYFVLPCCFFNFDRKFDSGAACTQSKYRNYLDFIVNIGEECGFKVEEDILKIPSTKRICSVGRERAYKEAEQQNVDNIVKDILKTNSCPIDLDKVSNDDSFTPREVTKDPKNCTQIDPHVKEKIVDALIVRLLEKIKYTNKDDDRLTSSGHKWSEWNAGDCISIPECAKLFNKDLLKSLKDQSGGLQSLLRNHQRIFKIQKGKVAFRDFRNNEEKHWGKKGNISRKADNIKTVGCWFFTSHPQGCVLSPEDCCYAHGEKDIRS